MSVASGELKSAPPGTGEQVIFGLGPDGSASSEPTVVQIVVTVGLGVVVVTVGVITVGVQAAPTVGEDVTGDGEFVDGEHVPTQAG